MTVLAPALLSLLLAGPPATPSDPPATVMGWYEDVFSGATRDGKRIRLVGRAAWFALPERERLTLLQEALAGWDRAQGRVPGAALVEVADAGRGGVYRFDGTTAVAITAWDLTRSGALETDLRIRGDRRIFVHLGGQTRYSASTQTSSVSLRGGTFLFKGRYDASVGLDAGSTKTDLGFGGGPSTSSYTSVSAMFRRHFTLPTVPGLCPSVGTQLSFPEGGDPEPVLVVGAGIRPSPKGFGLIDVTVALGPETTSFVVGLTYLVF